MKNITENTPLCLYNETTMFFYNLSGRNLTEEESHYQSVLFFLAMLATGLIIIILNALVLTAIVINRQLHYPLYYLLGNLAVTDLFVGISCIVITCQSGIWTPTLSINQWFFRQGLVDSSLLASLMNLMAIALERHQTIFTMQLHSSMSNHRVILLILGIWLIAIVIGMSPIMGWNCVCDLPSCCQTLPLFARSYVLTISVLSLLVMIVVVVLYACIFVYVWMKTRRMREHTSTNEHRETILNLAKTVLVILGCFVLCWTPVLLLLFLDGLHHVPQSLLLAESFIMALVTCNSLINPIIYTYRDNDMRSTFKHIFCCLCQTCQ
ncbi:lysophosphatidic acid receptor 1-A-like [Brachyhypopomus gauderio]|uniref:lysophosphatidic acid receptor 1-A-like n=1 Tax=Brachyhypopomus gauderio TaxID=698409 RepID=UPI004042340A